MRSSNRKFFIQGAVLILALILLPVKNGLSVSEEPFSFKCYFNDRLASTEESNMVRGGEVLTISVDEGYTLRDIVLAEWTEFFTYDPSRQDKSSSYTLYPYPADTHVSLSVTVYASKGNAIKTVSRVYPLYYPLFDDFRFEKTPEGCILTEYKGNNWDVVIPSEYNGEPVIAIDNEVFYDAHYMGRVTLPNSIRNIGEYAFSHTMLAEINLPDTVTTIGRGAFSSCRNLKEIRIPGNVRDIPAYAFLGCEKLEEIELPGGLCSIGESAFWGCDGLKTPIMPVHLMDEFIRSRTYDTRWIHEERN